MIAADCRQLRPRVAFRALPTHVLARTSTWQVTMSNCIICSNAEVREGASLKDAQARLPWAPHPWHGHPALAYS